MPFPRSSVSAVLKIQSGLHSGISLTLGRETTIGQSVANDVCLLDDGIAERHVRLTLHRTGLKVVPLSGPVAVNGASQATETSHRLAPGGDLQLSLGPISATLQRPRRKGLGMGFVAGVVALIAVGTLLPLPWPGANQSAALVLVGPVNGRQGTVGSSVAKQPTLQELSETISARFASLGLDRTMKISVAGAGDRPLSTTITGVMEPSSQADFEAFLAWYDAQPGSPALFNMTTRELPKEKELPRIASILLLPVPGLITDTGRHYEVGEELPGGWLLTSVDRDAVVLTLDGQSRVISLGHKTGPSTP